MAKLIHECRDNEDGTSEFTWHFDGVPSDPDLNSYYVRVVIDEGREVGNHIFEGPGAEDNAHGVDYTVTVPTDVGLYVQVINESASFWFEYDAVVTCASVQPTTEVSSIQVLPYTGVADWLLPIAIVLVMAGSWMLRLVRR